jgi:type I restriction enzyme S subunit
VDFEFPNEQSKPYRSSGGKMVDSELGEIPDGWKVGTLGDEFEIIMGQSPEGESYNETGDGMIFFQGRTDFSFRFPSIRLYTNDPKKIAEKLDTLVSVRAPVGDINMAFDTCCIGRGLAAVRSKYKSYTYYKIRTLRRMFENFESEGTVFGAMTRSSFENIEVFLPNKMTVKQFDEVIKPLDSKVFDNYQQIQTLSILRDILLPKLMNGKLRVRF